MVEKRLFAVDPALHRVASESARRAFAAATVPVARLGPGPFEPADLTAGTVLGLIVADGRLARTVRVPGGSSVELLSPWQMLQPATVEQPSFTDTSWAVLDTAELYVINSDLGRALAAHDELLNELVARGIQRAHVLTVSAAIESIVGVEKRVLLALWQLAEYCGSVTAEGVTMPLRLTHELLALLVGSRRPSVTSALAALAEQGQIARRSDRSWLLTGECPAGIRLPAARA